MNRTQSRARVNDNFGYIKRYPRLFCSNPNNFQFVTTAEQLLSKCFPRECSFLHEFDKLDKKTQRMYLKLLKAKKNGFWICQEKNSITTKSVCLDKTEQSPPNYIPSGQRSKVRCDVCFTEIEVPSNQLLVFCPVCERPYTNKYALEEDF